MTTRHVERRHVSDGRLMLERRGKPVALPLIAAALFMLTLIKGIPWT